jgi:hypothetical protein
MSMATIWDAPAMRAPLTALSPTPPAPKITTVAGADVRRVQNGPCASHNTAAEQRSLGERKLLRHDGELVLMDKRPFGKTAQPEALEQACPISGQARSVGRSAQRRVRAPALEGAAGQTSSAGPASLRERAHDVISDADLCDVGTDGGHASRDLVTEHRGRRNEIVGREEQVGVT